MAGLSSDCDPVAPTALGLLEAYEVPAGIVDADRRVVAANAAARAFAASADPGLRLIEGRAWSELCRTAEVGVAGPEVLGLLDRLRIGSAAPVSLEYVVRGRGRFKSFRLTAGPIAEGRGSILVTQLDTTAARLTEQRLSETEQRLGDMAELFSELLWSTGEDLRLSELKAPRETFWRRLQSKLVGRSLVELFAGGPNRAEAAIADVDRRRSFRHATTTIEVDGKVRVIRYSGKPMFADDGTFKGYVGTARDVTGMMAAAAEKEAAERRLKAAIEQMPGGIAIWDRDDRLVVHNADYLGLAGLTLARPIIGATFEEMLREFLSRGTLPPPAGDLDAHVKARVEAHRNPGGPTEVSLANGRILQLRERRLADGSTVSVASDITTLKKRERALSRQHALLQTILDHISDGILAVDEGWRITAANDTFSDLLGLPREMARVGVHFASLLEWLAGRGDYGPGEAQAHAGRIFESMAGRARWYDERVVPDGRQIAWRARRMHGGGRIIAVADVSEQRDADQRREQLRATMAQAEKLEAVAQLAGGLAHDLNNTLMPIIALTEVALEEFPAGSRSRTDLEKVVIAAEHARGLVQRLLTFSRTGDERGSGPLDPAVTDALEVVLATIGPNISVHTDLDATAAVVRLGATEIQQVVTNLGLNAAQAIGERAGTISVTTAVLDADEDRLRASSGRDSARRYARLTVSDDGPGIPADILPRVFDPFFTTKEVGKGTGLGLAVVHGLISRAGGWIEASSDGGAHFDVFLPVVDAGDGFMEGSDGTYTSHR